MNHVRQEAEGNYQKRWEALFYKIYDNWPGLHFTRGQTSNRQSNNKPKHIGTLILQVYLPIDEMCCFCPLLSLWQNYHLHYLKYK